MSKSPAVPGNGWCARKRGNEETLHEGVPTEQTRLTRVGKRTGPGAPASKWEPVHPLTRSFARKQVLFYLPLRHNHLSVNGLFNYRPVERPFTCFPAPAPSFGVSSFPRFLAHLAYIADWLIANDKVDGLRGPPTISSFPLVRQKIHAAFTH